MIYVNARFLCRNITGVDRFAIEICRQLVQRWPGEFCLVAPKNILHNDIAAELGVKIIGHSCGYFWEQFILPFFLKRQGCPLLLNLCSIAPVLYRNNILTLHDITWVRFPDTFSWRFRAFYNICVPILCRRARHIFTVSEFSRSEISSLYSVNKDRISVLYNAVNEDFSPGNPLNDEGKYFLAVSSAKANKNFEAIIKAFQIYDSHKSDSNLLIIGDPRSDVFRKINLNLDETPRIKCLGRVSDSSLIDYYRGAEAFIFPSRYEGFGLPALEAQACGAPVVASNTSSLPEILGQSAVLCNPDNPEEIASAMISISGNKTLRESLISKGLENVKRFSWAASAEKCMGVLKKF